MLFLDLVSYCCISVFFLNTGCTAAQGADADACRCLDSASMRDALLAYKLMVNNCCYKQTTSIKGHVFLKMIPST